MKAPSPGKGRILAAHLETQNAGRATDSSELLLHRQKQLRK